MNVDEYTIIVNYIKRFYIYKQMLKQFQETGETVEKYVTVFDTTYMIRITDGFFGVEGLEIKNRPAKPYLYLYRTDETMICGIPIGNIKQCHMHCPKCGSMKFTLIDEYMLPKEGYIYENKCFDCDCEYTEVYEYIGTEYEQE